MGLRRNIKEINEPMAVVEVGYPGPPITGFAEGVVTWDGAPEYVVHSAAMYLDEVLLRDRGRDARRFLDEVEGFFQATKENDLGGFPALGIDVLDEWDDDFYATVRTRLLPAFQARSTYTPKMKSVEVLHTTFWLYWNKTVEVVGDDAAAELRDNLLMQCAYYHEHGMSYRHLGRAVHHAMMLGSSDRLAAEIGAMAGLSADEFRALPEAERDRLTDEHTRRNLAAVSQDVDAADDATTDVGDDSLADFAERLKELLARRDHAEGLSDEDVWHRLGAREAEITHGANGFVGQSPLEEVGSLEARLEEANDPAVVADLEAQLTMIHANFIDAGRRLVEERGAFYIPFDGEEELKPETFIGSGRRRPGATQSQYWPSRELLRREHQNSLALRLGLSGPPDLNDLMEQLVVRYGG